MRSLWLVLAIILLTACQPVVIQQNATATCNPPYYEYTAGDCCLDSQPNQICDRNETNDSTATNLTFGAQQPPKSIVSDLIIKFRGNTTSYSFVQGKTEYLVYGDIVRVKLDTVPKLDIEVNNTPAYLTDIYVDRKAHTATGYCDARRERDILGDIDADRSRCMPIVDLPIPLPYESYNPELPEDWLTRFAYATPTLVETTDQYVKETTGWKLANPILHFTENNEEYILKIESKTGLPIKVETRKGDLSNVITYTLLIDNKVKPDEVIPQKFHQ